jgi:hypothetical protein
VSGGREKGETKREERENKINEVKKKSGGCTSFPVQGIALSPRREWW